MPQRSGLLNRPLNSFACFSTKTANGRAGAVVTMSGGGKVVCVTGASGFIASWLVKLLLQRGYTVRASVRDPADPKKTQHLHALEGATERLHLFKANLLEEGSFDAVVEGCDGVFHTASPFYHAVTNPQAELIEPAVKGTLNVLASCMKSSVKKVVVTSSMAAVVYNSKPRTPDVVVDETWFSSPEVCEQRKQWYVLSKTLAEEAAWKFSKENDIDIVTINPAMVIGPLLQSTLNTSSAAVLNLINGSSTFPNAAFGWVNVQDVAMAHVLAFELPSASGRYCLVERVVHFSVLLKIIHELYPSFQLPDKCADDEPFVPVYQVSKEKFKSLGLDYIPLETSIKETIESLKEKNFINQRRCLSNFEATNHALHNPTQDSNMHRGVLACPTASQDAMRSRRCPTG
ncbi:NmrA-like family [Musa troglodytarum]|uniref:NmrA-like family n=1 Tax=Musa troglodytarum TaxID=320322 RepID=A0A9E7KZK5_9LILI|nr:NmrA-like family [Musa troglodytarum]